MAFRKLAYADSNADNMFNAHVGQSGCCGDAVTENSYSNVAQNLGSDAIASIVIDGTTYTFGTPASTVALLETGIKAAFASAGYEDVENVGLSISGGDSAAVATIKTTATLTKFVTSGASDITLTAA